MQKTFTQSPAHSSVSPATAAKPPAARSPAPFPYAPLKVRNACFVESVHFYDEYLAGKHGGADPWARVLQWGNDNGNLQEIGLGHAVAICRVGDVLWMYDVNHGFVPLRTPVGKRDDITEVGPEVFARYPQFKPIFVSYREDLMPSRPDTIPRYVSSSGNADIRDAAKVANALGNHRVVRVLVFSCADPRSGQMRPSAAVLFAFGRRLCVYFPSRGTHLSRLRAGSLDDLAAAARIVRNVYPAAVGVSWQNDGANAAIPAPLRLIDVDVTLW